MSKTQLDEATNRQVLALQRAFSQALSRYMLSAQQADALIGDHGDPTIIYEFVAKLANQPVENPLHRQVKREWSKIYRRWFGLKRDFSQVLVQDYYDPNLHFAVIVTKGMTKNQTVAAMRKKFKVWLYTEDLDANIKDDRVADEDYCVLFRKNVEADEDLKNLSANVLAKKENFKGVTLLERFLLEILYFNRTKRHLDISNITLCSGSRDSVGRVPAVDFDSGDGKVDVYWFLPDVTGEYLRSRAAFLELKLVA